MATNSNNNGGKVRDLPEAEENLPEAHRDLQDRDPPEAARDLPAVDRERSCERTEENVCQTACSQEEKKDYHLGIEIVVILFMVALLYLVMTHTNNEGPKVTVLETEELQIPEEVRRMKL